MKGVFFILLMFLLGLNLKAQYILVENHGEIHFFDYQSIKKNSFKVPKDYILAEDISGHHFVGYAWERDSLALYVERAGVIMRKAVLLDSSVVIPRGVALQGSNLMSYYRLLKDPDAVYRCDDIVIKIRNRGHVVCYKGDSLLWEKFPRISSFGIGTYGLGYQNPVISQDKEKLLFQYATYFKQYLVEIDVLTGKETKIGRNADGTSYSYSPDGNYILYRLRSHRFAVYDRMNGKRKDLLDSSPWKNAFWFYR